MSNSKQRRRDIQLLRGLSIVLVFVFHLDLAVVLPGGFIGVDVFFVVSGYLVAGERIVNVLRSSVVDVDGGAALDLPAFFARRVARLFPASAAALLFVLALLSTNVLTFSPTPLLDEHQLRTDVDAVRAALLVSANVHYARNAAEYFSADSTQSYILHFWSLSIEEQFYFLFPLAYAAAFAALWRVFGVAFDGSNQATPSADANVRRATLLAVMLLFPTALLSAAACFAPDSVLESALGFRQSDRFYLLPFRLWQFLLGALVALRCPSNAGAALYDSLSSKQRTIAHWTRACCALALLLAGQTTSAHDGYPNVQTIGVCSATAIILALRLPVESLDTARSPPDCGQHAAHWRLLARVLGVVEVLGNYSYSIYLFHWPVIRALHTRPLPAMLHAFDDGSDVDNVVDDDDNPHRSARVTLATIYVVLTSLACTAVLSSLSYRFIEQRSVVFGRTWRPRSLALMFVASLVVGLALTAHVRSSLTRPVEALDADDDSGGGARSYWQAQRDLPMVDDDVAVEIADAASAAVDGAPVVGAESDERSPPVDANAADTSDNDERALLHSSVAAIDAVQQSLFINASAGFSSLRANVGDSGGRLRSALAASSVRAVDTYGFLVNMLCCSARAIVVARRRLDRCVILVGDSHARTLVPFADLLARVANATLVTYTTNAGLRPGQRFVPHDLVRSDWSRVLARAETLRKRDAGRAPVTCTAAVLTVVHANMNNACKAQDTHNCPSRGHRAHMTPDKVHFAVGETLRWLSPQSDCLVWSEDNPTFQMFAHARGNINTCVRGAASALSSCATDTRSRTTLGLERALWSRFDLDSESPSRFDLHRRGASTADSNDASGGDTCDDDRQRRVGAESDGERVPWQPPSLVQPVGNSRHRSLFTFWTERICDNATRRCVAFDKDARLFRYSDGVHLSSDWVAAEAGNALRSLLRSSRCAREFIVAGSGDASCAPVESAAARAFAQFIGAEPYRHIGDVDIDQFARGWDVRRWLRANWAGDPAPRV